MRNKLNCLIFDFDGVIADTDLGRYKALKHILTDYGIDLECNYSVKDIVGYSTKAFLVKNFKELGSGDIKTIIKERHDLFFSNLDEYCMPYENMTQTLNYLSQRFELVLVTTNSKENVEILLKHLGIFDLFQFVLGREICETNDFKKSYSQVKNIIQKEISECVVVEDSDLGVNAAVKEGYFCFRFDPLSQFANGLENVKVTNYLELKNKIQNYSSSC